ncbi:hypothetical protein J7J62_07870 [bacterium]|nr:hypothetical protein [bacterium]
MKTSPRIRISNKGIREIKFGKIKYVIKKKEKNKKEKFDEIWNQMKHLFRPIKLNKRQKKRKMIYEQKNK